MDKLFQKLIDNPERLYTLAVIEIIARVIFWAAAVGFFITHIVSH